MIILYISNIKKDDVCQTYKRVDIKFNASRVKKTFNFINMINWIYIFLLSLISIGGFIASIYESIAFKKMLPIGIYFLRNGIINIIGGILAITSIITSAFLNPWWTIFIVFFIAWIFSQILISIFKSYSQLLSVILMLCGIISIIIKISTIS